ncbi:MAG TPA: TetR/AcrR family transcriptional regulator [Saprospiraceae bacterium]|nr:TetR/AcrR family transcriptional regulator [Saprospiraceae bacterium]HPI08431.1 TetR/AcrR family transcriptional regulator [Saprospiraceae bacterium]
MAKKENQNIADSTEQKIFDAAHEVFVQKGMDGAKMQEIADRAGINKALLHYYYRSKDKLYEAVARAVIGRAAPMISQLIESDKPLEEKIRHFIEIYISIISKNPFIPLFIISEINKHPDHFFEKILPAELPKPQIFIRQVEEEIAAGRIRPVNPKHLVINIVSMCVFPFIAKPMARFALGLNSAELKIFLEERKVQVTEFVLASLRP